MQESLKKLLSICLAIVLIISTQPVSTFASEIKETQATYYLSDLEWVSATHGDATTTKTVQKDHPFTPGNNGNDTKISLLMPDGTIRTFDKGLGTVAASPSIITYNLTGARVSELHTYIGIDRTAAPLDSNHAVVEKVEIVVDDVVLYTSVTDHPAGIVYSTSAIEVTLEIPDGAKKLELKSYAGTHTWGDEVVFADAALTAAGTFPAPDDWGPNEYYLSDLEWVSATHGDATTTKTVQKDHPFTPGNNGNDTKISLLMPDGTIRTFDKGLGTVAASPSIITYNLTGARVSELHTYIGIDRTAAPLDSNHAVVEKVEIVVDDVVLYTSVTDHPAGIVYSTSAIEVTLEIPDGAKKLELKSYAGTYTWGDEVVFADAKITAHGPFSNSWEPAEKRREISNEFPLMIIPLYANGPYYNQAERVYGFWGDDTLIGKWEAVPDDLKPYTVIELHPDDLPMRDGVAEDFYEYYLEQAQNYVNPSTNKNEPIPLILTVYTAGNQSYYTSAHWLTLDWIEEMYQEYTCLQGIFCTENYWVWASGIEAMAAQYLELSAKYGGYFIWAEQNNGAAIEKALGSNGQTQFKDALESYWEYFVFMYKNTPGAEGNDAPTSSYMKGLWLSDYSYQWGGLMDTWKWYETGKWKLFETSSIGKTQGNRQWLTEPEALLGIEAMMIYLNGGCVYNFEHPAYTYGVRNLQSPLYTNVIQEFFRYAIANPSPTKAEILSSTRALLNVNYSTVGNGTFFVGLNTEMTQSPTYTTGRYSIIPAVPASISVADLDERLSAHSIDILTASSTELSSLENRLDYFNNLYPSNYSGDIFAQKLASRWVIYNYKYNENTAQTGSGMSLSLNSDVTWTASVAMEPHTYMILDAGENGVSVRLNNYRINKDELWASASNASEAQALTQMTKTEALTWVYTNYINNTQGSARRSTTLTLTGLNSEPTISNITGLTNGYTLPTVNYDTETGTATITITCNGYVYFDILA